MWDPPPPYSQPTSQENIQMSQNVHQSPNHHQAIQLLSTPIRCPPGYLNLRRGSNTAPNTAVSSPAEISSEHTSPLHLALLKNGFKNFDCTGSLPLNGRLRCYPLSQVKSLGNMAETTTQSLEVLFGDIKKISSVEKIEESSQENDLHKNAKYLKRHKNKKSALGSRKSACKTDQESDIYFEDVSSGVLASQKDSNHHSKTSEPQISLGRRDLTTENHLYEQVNANTNDEDDNSTHNSDDTVIVHTSSSDHSFNLDGDNTYSIISPLTDQSSVSPMTTDTEVYSTYQPQSQNSSITLGTPERNLLIQRRLQYCGNDQQSRYPEFSKGSTTSKDCKSNDNKSSKIEHNYEVISQPTDTNASDLNGNISSVSSNQCSNNIVLQASSTDIPFANKRPVPLSCEEESKFINQIEEVSTLHQPQQLRGEVGINNIPCSNPNSSERRLQSVQEHLFSLKSVNV